MYLQEKRCGEGLRRELPESVSAAPCQQRKPARRSTGLGSYLASRLKAMACFSSLSRPEPHPVETAAGDSAGALAADQAGTEGKTRRPVPPAGRDWRRRPVGKAVKPSTSRTNLRPGRFDRLEDRRLCAWVDEGLPHEDGVNGNGGLEFMAGPPGTGAAALEGPVVAGGPWSKAPPWPLREGETGFPSGNDNFGPVSKPIATPPNGDASSGGTTTVQSSGLGGPPALLFTDEQIAAFLEEFDYPQQPPSPGPLPPSPTISPKPAVTVATSTAGQGTISVSDPPAGISTTAVSTTATTAITATNNDSTFVKDGVCAGLPAFAGPNTYKTYVDGLYGHITGVPKFTPYDDGNNQGVVIGSDMDGLTRFILERPFDEANDLPVIVKPDSWFFDDSYLAWAEIVSARTYTQYVQIAGATLSNATKSPAALKMGVSTTATNTWTQDGSIGFSIGREMGASAELIEGSVNQTLNTNVSVSKSESSSTTYTKNIEYTVSPCDVVTLYHSYRVVELQIDYIYLEDTAFGDFHGYEIKRGTGFVISTVYAGVHGLQATEWNAIKKRSEQAAQAAQENK